MFHTISKVVLVTGSSSGIGEDVAISFSKCGAKVVVHGRNSSAVDEVASKCEKVSPTGLKPLKVVSDITNDDSAKQLVTLTIETFGQLDVLVNNAGIGGIKQWEDEDFMKELDDIMRINFRTSVLMMKLSAPHLIQTKGNIINIASTTAIKPVGYHNISCSVSSAHPDALMLMMIRRDIYPVMHHLKQLWI